MGFYSRKLKDYDGETSNVGIHVADLNAGNIAAQITAQADFGTALNGISLGSLQTIRYGNQVDSNQPAPTDPWAQRELKWRVDYRDTVSGTPYHFTVPCADATLLSTIDKGKMDLASAAGIAFETAFEAYALSPEGNAVELLQVVMVGRNI